MARGELLYALKVSRQMPRQVIVRTDKTILVHGSDDGYHSAVRLDSHGGLDMG